MTEHEISVNTIRGVMVGIEFPSAEDLDEPDLVFAMALDLLIFRVVWLVWRTA